MTATGSDPISSQKRPRALQAAIGPLMMAAAVWCAAGRITVASNLTASSRLAAPAAWWWFAIALVTAAMVPAWRRHPALAAPALLSTVPWWPVPLPPIALLWTGRLAWLPILVAGFAAAGASCIAITPPAPTGVRRRDASIAAGLLTLVIASATAWSIAPRVPGGDEPSYLIITESIITDHDLRIENNHARRDYARFFPGDLAPDFLRRGRNGQIYSIHAPGVAVLAIPGYLLFGYHGAQLTMVLVAALAGALIWRAAWRATGSSGAAWFAWAAVCGSITFLLQSATVFPDGPGAFAVAAGLWLIVELERGDPQPGYGALIGVSCALAALPWLHTRFVVLAAGLSVAVGWGVLADVTKPLWDRIRSVSMFAAVPAVSAIGWFGFFFAIYGTLNPSAPYGDLSGPGGTHAAYIPGGLAGLLFDGQFGLLTYSPVLGVAFIGLARSHGRPRRLAAVTIAVAGAYLAAAASYWMWWAGVPAPPARFAAASLPLFALPVALAWTRGRVTERVACALLLAVSWTISAVVLLSGRGALAWNPRDAEARWLEWLAPVVNLPRGLPSFFWNLTPGIVRSELPFGIHVVVFVVIGLAVAWLAAKACQRFAPGHAAALGPSLGLLLGLTAAVQAGWWVTGANPLDAARAQTAWLRAAAAGRPVTRITPGRIRSGGAAAASMTLQSPEPGRMEGSPPWLSLEEVPAGEYAARAFMASPRRGALAVLLAEAGPPFRIVQMERSSQQEFELNLPAGASKLKLIAESPLDGASGRVELVPRTLVVGAGPPAVTFARYPPFNVFFQNDGVFVERDGFWVKGGATALMAVTADSGRAQVTVRFDNGAAPNRAVIALDSVARTVSLHPGESYEVHQAITPEKSVLRLSVRSASGFRPSALSASTDRRLLGIRISLREGALVAAARSQ